MRKRKFAREGCQQERERNQKMVKVWLLCSIQGSQTCQRIEPRNPQAIKQADETPPGESVDGKATPSIKCAIFA
jgi:hypothetical protein